MTWNPQYLDDCHGLYSGQRLTMSGSGPGAELQLCVLNDGRVFGASDPRVRSEFADENTGHREGMWPGQEGGH